MLTPENQIEVWKGRIKRAYRARKKYQDTWNICREFYRGNVNFGESVSDRYVVNWMFSTIRQMASHLYFQNPAMFFTNKSELSEQLGSAQVMEDVIQYERRVMDAETEERKCIPDALLCGAGILKHGYHAEYGFDDPIASPVPKKHDKPGGTVLSAGSVSPEDDLNMPKGVTTEHNPRIKAGHPWKRRINPDDFLIDSEATCMEEARWMCHRIRRPWVDMIRDSRYELEAREQLQPDGQSQWFAEEEGSSRDWRENDEAMDASMCTAYEIFDRTTMRIITIASSCDVPLEEHQFPYFAGQDDNSPYEMLVLFPEDGSPWGIPYADTFRDQITTLNIMRTRMMDHLKRWGKTKGVTSVGGISPEDLQRFAESEDGDILQLQTSEDIDKIIKFLEYPPLPGDGWKLADMFYNDMVEVSGVSELDRGSGAGVGTATEASYIQERSGLRTGDMRYLFERFLKRSTRKDIAMLRQFWPAEKVMTITGPDGVTWQQMKVSRDLVTAEYEVDIEPGSTEKIDRNVRVRQTIDAMAQLTPMVPMLQAQGYDINWPEIVKTFLKNTQFVRNPDKLVYQLPPPPQLDANGQPVAPQQDPNMMQQGQGMGMNPQAQQAMTPAPMPVNGNGGMPWDMNTSDMGRMMSEALNGSGQ